MMLKYATLTAVTTVMVAASSMTKAAQPGEAITLDTGTGNYIITYCSSESPDDSCEVRQSTFVPATKIVPEIKSRFELEGGLRIRYRYTIRNGRTGRQPLISFILDPVSDIVSSVPLPKSASEARAMSIAEAQAASSAAVSSPEGWLAQSRYSTGGTGLRIGWRYGNHRTDSDGLPLGREQGGFGIISKDLPGIIASRLSGNSGLTLRFTDEGPGSTDILDQLNELQVHNYVTRFALVPAVPVPTPFDRAELLRRIDAQVKTWVDLKLLDAVVYSRIDRFIQAAIAAASSKDLKACGEHIGNIERQIHEIYESLEDTDGEAADENQDSPLLSRLAARVLKFDLNYALHQHAD
jgi:hypothetical protein